jgi:hypothetical protein
MTGVSRAGGTSPQAAADAAQMKTDSASPATGATVSFTSDQNDRIMLLTPAGALATLTVNFPSSPRTGQLCCITTSQSIAALSVGGGVVSGLVTALSGGDLYSYRCVGGTNWRRCI